MEKSTTAVGILFLAMVFLWLCCWTYALPNTTTTTWSNDTDPCKAAIDHCNRPPNHNDNGTGLQPIGRLAPAVPREKMKGMDYHTSRCYCDPQCRKYGDCCPDAVADEVDAIERYFANGSHQMEQYANPSAAIWECRHLPLHDSHNTYINVIGSCPTEYPLNSIHKRCIRSIAKNKYKYKLDLPVISAKTNLTYANIFCARCQNDSEVHHWNVHILWPFNANYTKNIKLWKYRPGENKWDNDNNDTVEYEVAFRDINTASIHYYYDMFEALKCRGGVVGTCPPSWTGVKERQLCAAYTYYIKLPNNDMVYKNEHCAKCNQKSALEEKFECPITFLLHYSEVKDIFAIAPYQCLLKFDTNNSQRCQNKLKIECKRGEVWDPIKQVCHPSTCGRNYRMDENGNCVKRIKAKPQKRQSSFHEIT